MVIRGFTSFATLYAGPRYFTLWEMQTTKMAMRCRFADVDFVEQQVVDDSLRIISVRPISLRSHLKRPTTRAECTSVPRPCPFVSCRWNTYLDLLDDGSLVINWGRCEPGAMDAWGSCVLDIADDGGISDELMARVLGITPKDVSALCEGALRKLRHYSVADSLGVFRSA